VSECHRLAKQMQLAFDDEPWYGPSLTSVLDEIPRKRIHEHPIPGAHSIAELMVHMAHWKEVVLARLDGDPVSDANPRDWARLDSKSATYSAVRNRLEAAHHTLMERVAEFTDADLAVQVAGNNLDRDELLQGILQHDIYHTGQLAVLVKALKAN
jgi:uncharacterized damage-inducible protein DinB